MRRPISLDLLEPLLKKPYFTSKEARAVGVKTATLHHYIKNGTLKRIRRGVYQSSTCDNPTFQWRDLIEAVTSISGGVICLISALAIYDLTEEIPRQHWIAVSNRTSVKKTREIRFIRFRNMDLGRTEIELEGVQVPIFDRERTIVDAFRFLSREVAIKALKMAVSHKRTKKFNLVKLQDYAKELRVNITDFLLTVTT
jgi:predicted transcriptional regulator of viral defense system